MRTSTGVSTNDGNHQLPVGLWGEFRDSIYSEYCGPYSLYTRWLSNTHIEPHIGNRIFQNMAYKEKYQVVFLMGDTKSVIQYSQNIAKINDCSMELK